MRIENRRNFRVRLFIDYQYQSINCSRLSSIVIDFHRLFRPWLYDNTYDYPCMYVLLFWFWISVVLDFVLVLRTVCTTNVWGHTEIFPRYLTINTHTNTVFCTMYVCPTCKMAVTSSWPWSLLIQHTQRTQQMNENARHLSTRQNWKTHHV